MARRYDDDEALWHNRQQVTVPAPQVPASINRAMYVTAFAYGMLSECWTKLRRELKARRILAKSDLPLTTKQVDILLNTVNESGYIHRLDSEQRVAIKMTLARRGFLK